MNVLNTVLVLVVVILLPFEGTRQAMSVFCLIWSSAVLLLKMVYQLDTIPLDLMTSNCTVCSTGVYSGVNCIAVSRFIAEVGKLSLNSRMKPNTGTTLGRLHI